MMGVIPRVAFRAAILFGLAAVLAGPARTADSPGAWRVLDDDRDLTDAAAPIPMGDGVLLDVTSLGPLLGISAAPRDSGFELLATDGKRWLWQEGDGSLTSDTESMPLASPGLRQGVRLYLPAETVAELARRTITIDAQARRVVLVTAGVGQDQPPPSQDIGDGWRAFTVPKPRPATPVRTFLSANKPPAIVSLPNSTERLNFGLGLGYVQGADMAAELRASGRAYGGDTSFWARITQGDRGTRLQNSYLTWVNKSEHTAIEAGDLYSEAWGLVRGARYLWNTDRTSQQSLGVYLRTENARNPYPALVYRDRRRLGRQLSLQSEVGSDMTAYASAAFRTGNLALYGFYRGLAGDRGGSSGVFGSLALGRDASLFFSTASYSDLTGDESRSETFGIRLPLARNWSFTVEQTANTREQSSSISRSAGLVIPVGNTLHLFMRYQNNASEIDALSGRLVDYHNQSDSLLMSMSFFASSRMHLNYQHSQYFGSGASATNEQLVANYRLNARTSLQTISGFPNIADPRLLRVRLEHKLQDGVSLTLDYGRLAPYQGSSDDLGERGFTFMVRKTWPLSVPAIGGKVTGLVQDQVGRPVQGVPVKLGQYRTVSDDKGRYLFEHVPAGDYELSIPSDAQPADYRVATPARDIGMKGRSSFERDFDLVPLGCITGRVYLDKNGNGDYDEGEGVGGIPLCANDRTTSTNRAGVFSFFNLEPGKYTVRIASEALDSRYAADGLGEVRAELKPDESVMGLALRVRHKTKPIIFAPVVISGQ